MIGLTNNNLYDFLQTEIADHLELPDKFRCNLIEKENDHDFWEELSEYLDCFRICDICHKPMIEGYYMDGTHYCSEACLQKDYTKAEVAELCTDDSNEYYYSVWYEN